MRRLFILAMAGAGLAAATPAAAAVTIVGPTATTSSCTAFSFSIADSACAGGYTGNLLQGTLQDPGLAALQAFGYTGTGTYLASIGSISGTTIDFGTMLTGMTLIGFHYGAAGSGTEATSFFLFNAGSGTQTITVAGRAGTNSPFGLSNAALFSTGGAVPEPATWALMLLGFAGIGLAMRRRRRPLLAQVS